METEVYAPALVGLFQYCRGNSKEYAQIALYGDETVSYQGREQHGWWKLHEVEASQNEWLEIHFNARAHLPVVVHWFERVPFTSSYRMWSPNPEKTVMLIPYQMMEAVYAPTEEGQISP